MTEDLITLLCISAYNAYASSLTAGPAILSKRFDFFKGIKPGDLVMEVTTMHSRRFDSVRIGYLVSQDEEPFYTPEEWEKEKDGWDGKMPKDRVYRIKLLSDGSDYAWENASFVRVANSLAEFPM